MSTRRFLPLDNMEHLINAHLSVYCDVFYEKSSQNLVTQHRYSDSSVYSENIEMAFIQHMQKCNLEEKEMQKIEFVLRKKKLLKILMQSKYYFLTEEILLPHHNQSNRYW